MNLFRQLFICLTFTLISSCVQLIDATTTGPIRQDPGKRTFGNYIDDKKIKTMIAVNLRKAAPGLEQAHVNVHVFNGHVLLTGEVPSEELRSLAGAIARDSHMVKQAYNELRIQGNSTFFSRTNDNWIATKVKSQLLASDNVNSSRVKTVVENRTVYIMGLLNEEEAEFITEIIKNTVGVEKVVRVIEYVDNKAFADGYSN